MIIGIDFDNTIAKYDDLFHNIALKENLIPKNSFPKDKKKIKEYIIYQPDGKRTWMRLQGLVYGKYMKNAKIMEGFCLFLLSCKRRDIEVKIISHKTEFGHYDPNKVSLRGEALKWMEHKNFFKADHFNLDKKNIHFASTRKRKVEMISALKCEWFIDDLIEVFEENSFPIHTKKILFNSEINHLADMETVKCSSWSEIYYFIFSDPKIKDIKFFIENIILEDINAISQVQDGGNSNVFKVDKDNSLKYALKVYPDDQNDKRQRLDTECSAISFLRKNNMNNIPEVLNKFEDYGIATFSWIDGKKITKPTKKHLGYVINFVKNLNEISKKTKRNEFGFASESCLSKIDLINQIKNRFKKLDSINSQSDKLKTFLNKKFDPIFQKLINQKFNSLPSIQKTMNLGFDKQILSPSDFGFHNAIENNLSEIIFFDFEYFGWDDPVKLVADFYWHPGMQLSKSIQNEWIKEMTDFFSKEDKDFHERLFFAIPFYGLRWSMIVLNDFLPGFTKKRKNILNKSTEQIQKFEQLRKAEKICDKVKTLVL